MDTVTDMSIPELFGHTSAGLTNAKNSIDQQQPLDAIGSLTAAAGTIQLAIDKLIAESLSAGTSWTQIGAALGISKQAAHQRFRHLGGYPRI